MAPEKRLANGVGNGFSKHEVYVTIHAYVFFKKEIQFMKVKEKKLDDGRVQLNVTATADDVDRAFDQAEASFARSLGLRPDPNKSARQAIAEKLSIRDVDSVVSGQAIEVLVPFALDKCSVVPQFEPSRESTDTLKRGKPYSFHLKVTPKPIYELTSYEPVEVTVPPFKFNDSEVDRQMYELAHMYPEYVTVDPHPVESGDSCLIALKVTLDGNEIEALTTDGRTYVCGEGYMPGDFDTHVIGMEPGQTKTFEFEAPDWDDPTGEAMKTYEATVTVKEIQEERYPELTDEWIAKSMPMYKSVEDLRNQVVKMLEDQQRRQYDAQVSMAVQAELAVRFLGSIPNEAYEATSQSIDQTLRMQVKAQNMDWDDFVKDQGGLQNYNMNLMMQARETLRRDYALDAVFDHEALSISDADIRDACMEINPQNPAGVQRDMERQGRSFALREVAARIAAAKYCVEHAKITVKEPEED